MSLTTAPAARPRATGEAHTLAGWQRALLLTLLYFCVVALGIAHHELWRDEWQAWMIARESGSLAELFRNLRYEGHPALWHLLLFGLSRFTRDPVAMQALHLLLATAAIYLLARYAPFSWPQKALIAFGYFFVYEYAVISRSYVLGVLLLFAFCALFPYRRRSYLPLAGVLSLMANTSAFGLVLALALGATLLFEWVVDPELRRSLSERTLQVAASVALFCVAVAVALFQIVPPADAMFTGVEPDPEVSWWAPRRAGSVSTQLWDSYVPIPDLGTPQRWNSNFLVPDALGSRPRVMARAATLLLSILLGVGALLLFRRKPAVMVLYLLGTFGLLCFMYAYVFWGHLRHPGHLYLLFVACLWLVRLPGHSWRPPGWLAFGREGWGRGFVLAILIAQVIGGAALYASDLRSSFSPARAAADRIRADGLDRLPIVGHRALMVMSVSGYLDREIYYPSTGGFDSFIPWRVHRVPAWEEFAGDLPSLVARQGGEVLLILTAPADSLGGAVNGRTGRLPGGLHLEPIVHLPAGLEADEEFHIYRVWTRDD